MSTKPTPEQNWRCPECNWIGTVDDFLTENHPFIENRNIYGCSRCKEAVTFVLICDEPGCTRDTCAGTPTPDGYRRTCHEHTPKEAT